MTPRPPMTDWRVILEQPHDAPAVREAFAGFTNAELEQIGDRGYLTFADDGVSLVLLEDMTVDAVQLHAEGHEGFRAYAAPLPGGIDFADGRAAARARLGPPGETGEASMAPVLGKQPPWDAFWRDGVRIHLLYTFATDAIQMVSLTRT